MVELVHAKGLVHRDLKPDNFLLGRQGTSTANEIHLVDFGMAKRYQDPKTQRHIPHNEKKPFLGTARYASINTHLGLEQSRRDDLETLYLVWLYFLRGSLPWQGMKAATNEEKRKRIGEKKQEITTGDLYAGFPEEFSKGLEYVRGLGFEDQPDYNHLQDLLSRVLPGGPIAASSSSFPFPCVLIHPSNEVRGQTHMVAAATRRTAAFFRDSGLSEQDINELRIIHISSTGASSRSQLTARNNDKLLSPGSFGISPLKLAVMQANQLPFPRPGRWVVENDSFFLLSWPLLFSGGELCLLVIERPTAGSSSPWRVCVDAVETEGDRHFAKSFRYIRDDDEGEKLLRTTTGIFLPHHLSWEIVSREGDYATRMSPLLIDIVLPRFIEWYGWLRLCYGQGYGVDAHLAWRNAEQINALTPKVELADGGPEMAFYHYGSDAEYNQLLAHAPDDPRLNSLAYVVPAARWRKRYVDPKLR